MDWGSFVLRVPDLIKGGVAIAKLIKKPGPEKKQDVLHRVIDAVPEGVVIAEGVTGKDIFNDAAIQQLLEAAVEAEYAAQKARAALQAGLLAKAVPSPPT